MPAEAGPLELVEFAGLGDPGPLLGARSREAAPFWEGLRERRLVLQRCGGCGRPRHPVAPVCPYCGGRSFEWLALGGAGTVHSWVRYRRVYLPQFEPPYEVLCVALAEGPRVFGRLLGAGAAPSIGMAVRAVVERFPGGECVLAFARADA